MRPTLLVRPGMKSSEHCTLWRPAGIRGMIQCIDCFDIKIFVHVQLACANDPPFCSKLRSSPRLTGQYWLPCPVQTCRTWVYEVKDGRYRKSTSTGAIWEAIQYRDGNVQELSRTFKNYILKARSVHCDTNEYRHSSPQSQQLLISDRALAPALMIVTSRPNRKILPKKSGVTPVRAPFPQIDIDSEDSHVLVESNLPKPYLAGSMLIWGTVYTCIYDSSLFECPTCKWARFEGSSGALLRFSTPRITLAQHPSDNPAEACLWQQCLLGTWKPLLGRTCCNFAAQRKKQQVHALLRKQNPLILGSIVFGGTNAEKISSPWIATSSDAMPAAQCLPGRKKVTNTGIRLHL
jgi:hypothetical protein